jgi:hypothetical protein
LPNYVPPGSVLGGLDNLIGKAHRWRLRTAGDIATVLGVPTPVL